MPAFEYQAVDERGRTARGILDGDTPRQVRQQLRDQGLTPLQVLEVRATGTPTATTAAAPSRLGTGRLRAADLTLVTRQLATLLRSGAPLAQALEHVARQNERAAVRRVMSGVRAGVMEGHSLAGALGRFPGSFPELYRATIEAGESSGHLDAVLERLADYTESRQGMQQKIGHALIYPVILTGMAILVLGALLGYVVPQVVQVFDSLGQTLPWLTRALIAVSAWVQAWGLWTLGALVLAGLAFGRGMRRPGFRRRVQRVQLRLPLLGRLLRGLDSARFARTLSILAASGVPILQALTIAARVMDSLPMRQAVEAAAVKVREGSMIHRALESAGYFPPMTLYLIASGEASGQLQTMLERAAVQQERETDMTLSTLLALFEPLLILVMGGLVLVIVLAILLPIFEINQLIG